MRKHAVTHALNKGYEVTAYLRNPEKLTARAENLTVVKGEITDYAWMKIAISGCDAVVWCIGVNGDGAALAGHKLLIKAMKETGVKRLVDYGTPFITERPKVHDNMVSGIFCRTCL